MRLIQKVSPGKLVCALLFLAMSLAIAACDQQVPPAKQITTQTLLQEGISSTVVELPSEAFPAWREHAGAKPALLLFADDPMLQPVPLELRAEVKQLLTSGTEADIRRQGPLTAATAILPSQTLSAALEQNLFSEVIWVTSRSAESAGLEKTTVVDTLFQLGVINDYESESFAVSEFGLAGTVQEMPFQIVYHDRLPPLTSPVLLHFDLSFLNGLYDNEIKTPLFQTLKALAHTIREQNYQAVTSVVSLSNLVNWVPLNLRFTGQVIEEIISNPQILDQTLPDAWDRKSRALYLDVFFQNEERAKLFQPLVEENPEQPADIYWELYATTIKIASYEEALDYLELAVERDPVYAIEYTRLADKAVKKGLPDIAAELLQRAVAVFPQNPYIKLQEIKVRSVIGVDPAVLRSELDQLRQLPWSQFYSVEIIAEIDATLSSLTHHEKTAN